MRLSEMTLAEIEAKHEGQYVESFDAGTVWDEERCESVSASDVMVWRTEEESEGDSGYFAVARYLIRD